MVFPSLSLLLGHWLTTQGTLTHGGRRDGALPLLRLSCCSLCHHVVLGLANVSALYCVPQNVGAGGGGEAESGGLESYSVSLRFSVLPLPKSAKNRIHDGDDDDGRFWFAGEEGNSLLGTCAGRWPFLHYCLSPSPHQALTEKIRMVPFLEVDSLSANGPHHSSAFRETLKNTPATFIQTCIQTCVQSCILR